MTDQRTIERASGSASPGGIASPVGVSLLIAALAAAATFALARESMRQQAALELPASPPPIQMPETSPDLQRARFYDGEVEPEIAQTDRLNREAAARCVSRLQQVFRGYRAGVEPFVDDLSSISTRLGIARRLPGKWWSGDDRIEDYVREKFERHLFTQRQLYRDIAEVLEDFRQDVEANQRRMLVDVRASLDTSDLPEIEVEQYEPFFQAVAEQLNRYSADSGTAGVYNGLTILIVSEAGSYAAVTLVAGLLARFGSAAAATTAAGVGATAGTTAAGAGSGSLVGPVGTVVGLGVGLAVGLIIDWWMTDRFEQQMKSQMLAYLNSLEATILSGSSEPNDASLATDSSLPGSDASASQPGLVDALPELCTGLADAYRQRFYEQIVLTETAR